jgi:predicted GNAT family acetyltransferase
VIQLKTEYIKIMKNNPVKKAKIVTKRISEKEYEIIEFDIPIELRQNGIAEQLLKEVTNDADNEGVTLHVDINKIMANKDH